MEPIILRKDRKVDLGLELNHHFFRRLAANYILPCGTRFQRIHNKLLEFDLE